MCANEAAFGRMLEGLRDIDIVGEIRGVGYFRGLELTRGRAMTLSRELLRNGLICRGDQYGDPVIQLAPPLTAGPEQFEEMEAILRPALIAASATLE